MTAEETGTRPSVGPDAFGRQGFGAMRLRDGSTDNADRDPVAVIHAALDAGIRMVDTADAYQNEELVGRAIRGRRDEVVLASKFGLVWRDEIAGGFDVRADRTYVQHACEASLRRAHAAHPVAALQEQWSLVHRDIEQHLLPAAADLGVVVVAHSPTSHGFLHRGRSMADKEAASGRLGALDEIATTHDATAGQVALAWVHHRQHVHDVPVVPIPGTSSVNHLRSNVAAAAISLSGDELRRLDALGTKS